MPPLDSGQLKKWRSFRQLIHELPQAIDKTDTDEKFDAFCRAIQSKSTIDKTKEFLDIVGVHDDTKKMMNPRVFLTAKMIACFPDQILHEANLHDATTRRSSFDEEKKEEEDAIDAKCLSSAAAVVEKLDTDDEKLTEEFPTEFLEALYDFDNSFEAWKSKDRRKMLRILCERYIQYEESVQFFEEKAAPKTRDIFEADVRQNQHGIKQKIIGMAGEEYFDDFMKTLHDEVAKRREKRGSFEPGPSPRLVAEEGSEPPELKLDDEKVVNLDKIIQDEGSKKYWADFAQELEDKKFDRLLKLITEVSDRIKKLIPNRADLHANLDKELDLELIKQQIHFEAMDVNTVMKIFQTIWTAMKNLQPAADDSLWEQWRVEQMETFSDSSASWSSLLPPLFNQFLMKLDRIEDIVEKLADRMEKEQDAKSSAE